MRRLEQDTSAPACLGSQVSQQPEDHLHLIMVVVMLSCLPVLACGNLTVLCCVSLLGAKCEMDVDECDSAPCQNGGLCKDGMGDFQCQCKPGFLGEQPGGVFYLILRLYWTFYWPVILECLSFTPPVCLRLSV